MANPFRSATASNPKPGTDSTMVVVRGRICEIRVGETPSTQDPQTSEPPDPIGGSSSWDDLRSQLKTAYGIEPEQTHSDR